VSVVLKLAPVASLDIAQAIKVIDDLRARVESGEVKAFAAVGITPEHETMMWASCTKKTTRLEMMGAISNLQHCYNHGDPS
jgi:hypothetical protein